MDISLIGHSDELSMKPDSDELSMKPACFSKFR